MSDLRFARELGVQFERLEFERLERAGAVDPGRRRVRSGAARVTSRVAMGVALAIPVAIVVIALVSLSRGGVHRSATGASAAHGFAVSGGNCAVPVRTGPTIPGSPPITSADGLVRGAGGRVSGIAWELRVKPNAAYPGTIAHGRLHLGADQYGLCSQQSVPVPFGLINAGAHGIVYGYVANGGGSYRITVAADITPLRTSIASTFFFIAALPRPACAYHLLSVAATSTPVTGLPPNISRSLDENATRFTTTMRFGECRPHALVTAVSERGQTEGRDPNAPLAQQTAQLKLVPPSGARSHARGWVFELTHGGNRGMSVLAFGLRPGPYGIWLLGPRRNQVNVVTAVTSERGELQGSYDLPAAVDGRQIVVATERPGQIGAPGTVVLRATLR